MKLFVLLLIILCAADMVSAQEKVRISGVVSDIMNGEPLPGASVYESSVLYGTTSNSHGYYSMVIPANLVAKINVSFIGYSIHQIDIVASTDTVVNIKLSAGVSLDELQVTATRKTAISKELGMLSLPVKEIVYSPVLMGESNVISSLKTLPGISSGKEGGSELFVRGGNYDQNLVVFDESPVYNLNHAFGLLSVFNTNTLKTVDLYKGGFPAEYGGRLSSVLDMSSKDGNKKRYVGEISLSSVAGALTFEGPIKKDKSSFIVSLRRSWIDKLLFFTANTSKQNIGLYFYDINAKMNFKFTDKHRLHVSYYSGKDEFNVALKAPKVTSAMSQGWGNNLFSLRYNSIIGNGVFSQVSLYYSEYYEYNKTNYHNSESRIGQGGNSSLYDMGLKSYVNWTVTNNISIKAGVDLSSLKITPPSRYSAQNGVIAKIDGQDIEKQLITSAYSSFVYKYNRLNINVGLRATHFYGGGIDKDFIEPRFNASYVLSNSLKAKVSAMKSMQHLYAMRKSNNGFPGYSWLPLGNQLPIQEALLVSAGFSFSQTYWFIDVEGYLKRINNQAGNYRFPYDIYSSNQWFTLIDQGEGLAKGFEFIGTFKYNTWDVRLSYTLSDAKNRYDNVNDGRWFPFDYDIRHDASVVASKTIYSDSNVDRWLTGSFVVHSGVPVSVPTYTAPHVGAIFEDEYYYYDFSKVDYYNHPNNARLPLYHRLDVAYHTKRTLRCGSRTWSLGLTNLYNQQNPYIYFRDNKGDFKQLVMFPIMPFVSFKRNF